MLMGVVPGGREMGSSGGFYIIETYRLLWDTHIEKAKGGTVGISASAEHPHLTGAAIPQLHPNTPVPRPLLESWTARC
jgi:hypothetical protein